MKKMLTTIIALIMVAAMFTVSFADTEQKELPDEKDKVVIDKNDPLYQDLLGKRDELKELRKELREIREELIKQTDINKKMIKEIIENIDKSDKDLITKWRELKDEIKGYWNKQRNINKSIRGLQIKKRNEFIKLRNAIKTGKLDKALEHAQNILDLKSEIIEKAKEKLELKKKVTDILRNN